VKNANVPVAKLDAVVGIVLKVSTASAKNCVVPPICPATYKFFRLSKSKSEVYFLYVGNNSSSIFFMKPDSSLSFFFSSLFKPRSFILSLGSLFSVS